MALATTPTTETVDLIDDLCSRKEGWSTIVPIDRQAAVHAPSESKNHYSVLPGVPDEVLTHLKNELHKLFDETCYNNVALVYDPSHRRLECYIIVAWFVK